MRRRTLLVAAPLLTLPKVGIARFLSGGNPIPFNQINTSTGLSSTISNAYGTWAFGPAVTPSTGAGPPGPFGTFNYVKLNGEVINRIARFDVSSNRTGAQQIVYSYGNNIFFLIAENDRIGVQYADYDGFGVNTLLVTGNWVDPTSISSAPLPNYSPPYTPSPDGTTLTSTAGTLINRYGTWDNNGGGSTWFPNLNGIPFNPADNTHSFTSMEVNCNGNLFLKDASGGHWFAVLSLDKYDSGSTTIPAGPIPITVTLTPNASLITGAPPLVRLTTSTPTSTVLGTVSVTMSDSSSFAGTLSLLESQSWIGMSGANVVTTGTPVSGLEFNITVGASQGGMAACSPGPCTIIAAVA